MRTRKSLVVPILSLLLIAVFLLGMSGAASSLITKVRAASNPVEFFYYNDMVNEDDIGTNNFNFGPNRKVWAEEAIANGEAENVQDFIAKSDGTGDFFDSIRNDPALLAAIALDMDETLNFDEPILVDEQTVLIGKRADEAHQHFLKDPEYWERAYNLVKERLLLGEISLKDINSYTSSMYMYPDRLEGDKPSVIVRDSQHAGGTFLQFDLGEKVGVVKYRIECGYQPVDTPYWPTPPEPPIPDNPEPTPEPEPEPEPEPTPEPKDPEAGPQGQVPDNPEFGGGENHENNEEITPEPTSPESYTPPAPPEPEYEPEETEPTVPETSAPTNPPKPPTIDDHNNGGTEIVDDEEYEVVVGGQNDDTTIDEAYDNQDDSTVEEPVAGDVNDGYIGPPE